MKIILFILLAIFLFSCTKTNVSLPASTYWSYGQGKHTSAETNLFSHHSDSVVDLIAIDSVSEMSLSFYQVPQNGIYTITNIYPPGKNECNFNYSESENTPFSANNETELSFNATEGDTVIVSVYNGKVSASFTSIPISGFLDIPGFMGWYYYTITGALTQTN